MNKDKLLKLIRKDIHAKFPAPSQKNAAESFNVSEQALSNGLNGVTKGIPKYLLEFSGYTLGEPNYVKVKK
jgi:hypothetical protein